MRRWIYNNGFCYFRVSLPAAQEISMDAAVTAVLSKVDDIFTSKADQRMTRNTSSVEGKFFVILLTDSGKALV